MKKIAKPTVSWVLLRDRILYIYIWTKILFLYFIRPMVKLHLEYANAVKKGYIEKIKKVQKRAATIWPLSHDHSSS